MKFELPPLMNSLIASGVWPSDSNTARAQNLRSLVTLENLHRLASDEDEIFLQPPPFRTLAHEVQITSPTTREEFWHKLGALNEVDAKQLLIIGDFGLGTDAPIVLNYARNSDNPEVLRLRWYPDCSTGWVLMASSFEEFAKALGLIDSL